MVRGVLLLFPPLALEIELLYPAYLAIFRELDYLIGLQVPKQLTRDTTRDREEKQKDKTTEQSAREDEKKACL